ncbi:hypothetical protein BG000_005122 [Podila horticola]|nr:hypothetical protein BG000_005122 [Podila horticola]
MPSLPDAVSMLSHKNASDRHRDVLSLRSRRTRTVSSKKKLVRQHNEDIAMVDVCDGMTMAEQEDQNQDQDQDQDEMQDSGLALAPIDRLCPEILALIFHFVYVTPVVHKPNHGSENMTSAHSASASGASESTDRRRRDKRKSTVYIQNDLSSMLALCLTCRAFYPQAVRMLWRHRTLASYDDLGEFYQAIDFSTLKVQEQKQMQKQKQKQQDLAPFGRINNNRKNVVQQLSIEEEMFSNEAALRIKALTLLDMPLNSPLSPTSSLGPDSTPFSTQFFGSSSGPELGNGLELRQGLDALPKAWSMDEGMMMAAYYKDLASQASSSSPSSSSSSSSSSAKKRLRQKTTSVYSQMISPRLLHTIANHCYALVDLTICMDSNALNSTMTNANMISINDDFSVSAAPAQPTIPFSILAGALQSLKRLTLMGLICNPPQNKTGSELLIFAQNSRPLERLSIRSCLGISLETMVELAVRSHQCLELLDFQGMDFKSSQELTDMMSAYAQHCPNIKSITLSCLRSLQLDGMMDALANGGASQLKELHVLGVDVFRTPQQQPGQQQQAGNPVPIPMTQMCHLTQEGLASLSRLVLRRLTLYCTGITDYALLQFLRRSTQLVDLVLNEPTTVLHQPQFHHFVQQFISTTTTTSTTINNSYPNTSNPNMPSPPPLVPSTLVPMTSAGFLSLILRQCPWVQYLFMKLTVETAQEWVSQPCFEQEKLDRCLYQYRAASGAPAIVLMWDARKRA